MQRVLVGAIAALIAASPAYAQRSEIRLRGYTRTTVDSAIVSGAEIALPDLGRTTRSDRRGGFELTDVRAGRWHLTVRRLGYAPLDTVLAIDASDTGAVTLWLEPTPPQLDTISVTTSAQHALPASATLREFDARRARGVGRFITSDQLRAQDERRFVDVLRAHVPGLALQMAADGVHAYNPTQQPPGALIRGGRGTSFLCYVQVIVDGISIYSQSMTSDRDHPPPDLTEFLTQSLDGVEYYSGPSRTPPEFRTTGAACGTLVLWTRRR